ncbi:MAG TPA: hypothetical protein VK447_08555 [Myxococcaceae bacterium]|nr:hypothetical protein [Myxococcaceae bacterium]
MAHTVARTVWRSVVVLAVLVVMTGCPDRAQPPAADAGVPDAGLAQVEPPKLELVVRYQSTDGGMVPIPFEPAGRPFIEPTQQLQVGANLGLRNYRIRLFDEADRAVISDDDVQDTPNLLDYRLQLPNPLRTGHRYTLVVDAETGESFTDSAGRPQPDQRLEFQIAGEKEKSKPAPPAKGGKSKKRR